MADAGSDLDDYAPITQSLCEDDLVHLEMVTGILFFQLIVTFYQLRGRCETAGM